MKSVASIEASRIRRKKSNNYMKKHIREMKGVESKIHVFRENNQICLIQARAQIEDHYL